jgi:hypothetical protein
MDRMKYLNGVLTVIAVLMGLVLLNQSGLGLSASRAEASQPERGTGLVSAADQRKQMIEELKKVSARMEKLEKAIEKGVNVKVTSLPEVKKPEEGGDGK